MSTQATDFPSALFQAIRQGNLDQVKSIYSDEGGANIDTVFDEDGDTPLIRATCRGETVICEFLISAWRASPEATNRIGRTALMEMIRMRGGKWPAKLAAQLGSSVNAQDRSGRTALMFAVQGAGLFGSRRGNLSIVRQLLELGADVSLRDHRGLTAVSVAQRGNAKSRSLANQDVVDFLEDAAITQRALADFHRNYHYTFDASGELTLQSKPAP